MKMEQTECSKTLAYKNPLTTGSGYFWAKPSPVWIPQQFSNFVILHLPAYEDGTDSVPKRWDIKFRRRGITQKKTYKLSVAWITLQNDALYRLPVQNYGFFMLLNNIIVTKILSTHPYSL